MKAPEVDTNPNCNSKFNPYVLVDAAFLAVLAVLIWITQYVMHSPQSVTVVRIRSWIFYDTVIRSHGFTVKSTDVW